MTRIISEQGWKQMWGPGQVAAAASRAYGVDLMAIF